jgi:hypothetical protein
MVPIVRATQFDCEVTRILRTFRKINCDC